MTKVRIVPMLFAACLLVASLPGCSTPESLEAQSRAEVTPHADSGALQATRRTAPDTPGSIPDRPASGKAHGMPFRLERAELQNNILTLHGEENRTFFVFLFLDDDESLVARRFAYKDAEIGDPHIHMHYRSTDGIEIDTFMEDYTLELEFDRPYDGTLRGRIYLVLPDESGSFVSGRFEAELRG